MYTAFPLKDNQEDTSHSSLYAILYVIRSNAEVYHLSSAMYSNTDNTEQTYLFRQNA